MSDERTALHAIDAAILAGGLGMRLRPVVGERPKVLAPVGGRPFIAYLLDRIAAAGCRRVVLCTGYRGEEVEAALGAAYRRVEIVYSREPEPLGTGGALRHALPALSSETVLVMNGDSFCEIDLASIVRVHEASRAAATLAAVYVPDAGRFGRLELAPDGGTVLGFLEKEASAGPGWINAGIYVLARAAIASISAGRAVSLEREIFPALAAAGALHAFRFEGDRFIDIGTPESYRAAERRCAGRSARRRFAVLDRDGTLILHRHYLADPDAVELVPGVAEGLRALRDLGLGLVVITNQSAVARGLLDRAGLEAIHERLRRLLAAEGIVLDGMYICPHLPEEACVCRKPRDGLLRQAGRELDFDPAESFVIGDKACDIGMGQAVGATTFMIRNEYVAPDGADCAVPPTYRAGSFSEVVDRIRELVLLSPR